MWWCWMAVALGQDTLEIRGEVVELITGGPVPGAEVRLGDETVTTDVDGGFLFERAEDAYVWQVRVNDWSSREVEVPVNPGTTWRLDLYQSECRDPEECEPVARATAEVEYNGEAAAVPVSHTATCRSESPYTAELGLPLGAPPTVQVAGMTGEAEARFTFRLGLDGSVDQIVKRASAGAAADAVCEVVLSRKTFERPEGVDGCVTEVPFTCRAVPVE